MNKDIFALLEGNSTATTIEGTLPVITVWRIATHYLMFFTLYPDQFASHYDEETKTAYLCNGDGCPACEAALKPTEHIYLPAWDAQNRRIVVLKFDTRENGPAAQILPFLKTYRNQLADIVAVVRCEGGGKFTITGHKPKPETEKGALQCSEFCRAVNASAITLKSCVKSLSDKQMAELASVKRAAIPIVGDEVIPASEPVSVEPPAGVPVNTADVAKGVL